MPRHDHNLKRRAAAAYPSQLLTVAVNGEWEDTGERPATQRLRLVSWHGVGCQGKGGTYGPDRAAEGLDQQSFWEALDKRLAKGGLVWAFAPQATLTFGMLGLWEQIERKEILLVGGDYRDCDSVRSDGLSVVPGGSGLENQHGGQEHSSVLPEVQRSVRGKDSGQRSGAIQRDKRGMGYVVLEDPPVIVDCRRRGISGTLRIVDTANYGVATTAWPTRGDERATAAMAFVRSMVATLFSERLGSLKPTVGSQSMTGFCASHITTLTNVHNDLRALGVEERGYYGGRCECFRLGALPGPIYHLDVSAMYPAIYASEPVPVCLHSVRIGLPSGFMCGHEDAIRAIADVTVATDEPAYPLRDARLRLTVWPVGEFRTTLAGAELAHALNEGRIRAIHNIAHYHTAPLLASYAECVLRLRNETRDRPALNQWVKAMGNCLVGKFGQRDRRWVAGRSTCPSATWDSWYQQDENRQWERWRSVGGFVQREEIGGWSFDAIPSVACFVTAAARMRLLAMIRCAGWENVYYTDTDSLMVGNIGVARLAVGGFMEPGAPGFLRVKAVNRDVNLYGIKDYAESGLRVKAGVPVADRAELATLGSIWTEPTVAGYCRGKRQPGAKRVRVAYASHGTYRHGVRCADGSVRPLRYGGLTGVGQETD